MVKDRLEDNKEILRLLNELINKYPQQRFGQLLINYVIPPEVLPRIVETGYDGSLYNPEGSYFIKHIKKELCN